MDRATRECYAVIPGGIPHDFENRGLEECGLVSINAPAGFEERMSDVVKSFADHRLGDGRRRLTPRVPAR